MTERPQPPSLIDYEALEQDAKRAVVRSVLTEVARTGLPGDHHFFISFDTQAPGALLSKRLKEKYPSEMTIVLQHRFWDLIVTEERFEVKLTFDGIPERLVVPFKSVRVFFDPLVRYGLQFEEPAILADMPLLPDSPNTGLVVAGYLGTGNLGTSGQSHAPQPRLNADRKPRAPRRTKLDKPLIATEGQGGEPLSSASSEAMEGKTVTTLPGSKDKRLVERKLTSVPSTRPADVASEPATSSTDGSPKSAGQNADKSNDAPASSGATIVSLDAFRKK